MRLLKIPLILFAVSPALAIYRSWRLAQAQVQGLLTSEEMQRQLVAPISFSAAVYLACLVGCIVHMRRNPRMGSVGMIFWIAGIALFPIVFAPLYIALHVGR